MKKIKFKSAEEKRRYEENQKSWDALCNKYTPKAVKQTSTKLVYNLPNPPGRDRQDIRSVSTSGGSTAKKDSMVYTGEKIKGIGTMHKSNMVPIFHDHEAKEIASMRR